MLMHMLPNLSKARPPKDRVSKWLPISVALLGLGLTYYLRPDILTYLRTSAEPDFLPSTWAIQIDWRLQLLCILLAIFAILQGVRALRKGGKHWRIVQIAAVIIGLFTFVLFVLPIEFLF